MKLGIQYLFSSKFLCVILCALCVSAVRFRNFATAKEPTLTYPKTRKVEQVDDYHGVKIADPYRWLEDGESADVSSWVDAQNRLTENTLSAIPERRAIHGRLEELLGIGDRVGAESPARHPLIICPGGPCHCLPDLQQLLPRLNPHSL